MKWRLIIALVGTFAGTSLFAGPGPDLILGIWSSGSRPYYDVTLNITPQAVTFGECTSSYEILSDEYRSPRNPQPAGKDWRWRHIALKLRPDRTKEECRYVVEVLELAIPDEMACHADLATFKTLGKFQEGDWQGWSVWANVECARRETPDKSLERTRER